MTHRKQKTRVIKLLACLAFSVSLSLVYAYSSGPVPGMTGAPGESNCTECHDSFGEETNTGGGFVAIIHPKRYEAGQRLTITVEVGQTGQRRWGFQLTALTTDTNEPVGQFVITDPVHTQLIQGPTGRWYVEHTEAGTYAGTSGGAEWSFDWIAPETDKGIVAFYAAGNAANNDDERLNDWIYTTLSTISPPSFPATTVLAPNGNEVLGKGEKFTIQWEATANAEVFDLLFFPFPGSLPETIVSGLPREARSYEWMVPDIVSESASIAVLAFNNAGFGIDESEKSFMIVDKSSQIVQVLEPNNPREVTGGTTLTITWSINGNVNLTGQQVRLSLDGGRTFPLVLAPSLPAGARSLDWLVPTNIRTQSARVLVLARVQGGNIVVDAGDTNFVISNPPS
jgi:hypothetical protein